MYSAVKESGTDRDVVIHGCVCVCVGGGGGGGGRA